MDYIKPIIDKCVNLYELNLQHSRINFAEMNYLVANITSKIEKLSLHKTEYINDDQIITLVTRCNNLKVLDLGSEATGVHVK